MFREWECYLLTILAAFLLGLESGFRHGVHGGLQHLGTSHLCAPLSQQKPDEARSHQQEGDSSEKKREEEAQLFGLWEN